MTAPTLETERLILRPHRVQDFEAVAALWAEPEVVRFISGTPSTPEESWARLLRYIGHWQALGFGYWAVTLRENGLFIGEVGFADYQRGMEPPLAGVPEAGWVLAPEVHGQGIATEAVGRIHDWAAEMTDWAETACIFDPSHKVSHRVALKLGYAPAGEAQYRGSPTLVMKRAVRR
ncbi:GNAT family N-acetyltransferase [Leisingera sp. ANG-M7]|uniref:GNAT family N-acetyltransferase n=1 Tax=Leisingera sp. ANG-M7 TaxID=1577902 RepID=UPI00057D95F6|nr:GNAT family N-acetyltransferase [Leisingera sp. ANG-M7]KIC36803.1 acetyltransferase [Leisingera sp. ANG-M7]